MDEGRNAVCIDIKRNISYVLDRKPDILSERTKEDIFRTIYIVRIKDEQGREIANARMYGTSDEASDCGRDWANDICRANPGLMVQWTYERAEDYERHQARRNRRTDA